MRPIITRDPVSGGELVVTRLESPASGIAIEGRFALGWPARLSPEQLEFARMLLLHRGNVQKVAALYGMAYNTARARLDAIVAALGGVPETERHAERLTILDRLAAREIDFASALRQLRGD